MPSRMRRAQQRVSVLFFYGFVVVLIYLVYRIVEPFLTPLAWAGVLAVCFYPLYDRLKRRWGAGYAALASTLLVTIVLVVPGIAVGAAFVREASNATRLVNDAMTGPHVAWFETIRDWIEARLPGAAVPDLQNLARNAATTAASYLAGKAGGLVINVAGFLLDLFITLFALFFLFRDSDIIIDIIRRALPFEPGPREAMLAQAYDLIQASVTATLVVATVQGTIGGLAFAALGLPGAVFWGVIMILLSCIPMAGSWVVWGPAAIALMIGGSIGKGITLIAIGAGLIGLVDNVLRPALMSGRSRLNGFMVFVSLLGGIAVFGLLGLVLGPIILATAASLFEVYMGAASATATAEAAREAD